MEFMDYINLVKRIYPEKPKEEIMRRAYILKNIEKDEIKNKEELYELIVRKSYDKIFKMNKKKNKYQNEFFLDFETRTEDYDGVKIEIYNETDCYCFLPDELIQIFHHDLNRSVPIFEHTSNIWTLQKCFRPPYQPYNNQMIKWKQLKEIISQFLYYNIGVKKYPEVNEFMINAKEIVLACEEIRGENKSEKLSDYETTSFIYDYFENKGLYFKEEMINNWRCKCGKINPETKRNCERCKTKKKTGINENMNENKSKWIDTKAITSKEYFSFYF